MDMYNSFYEGLKVLERRDTPLEADERIKAAAKPLLLWYGKNRRILPWREENTPYRVWVSEIMLQQTRVEAVKPYFSRFMEELPDIRALACVEEERLLKLWEGLGYYTRARNLKKAAKILTDKYDGEMPASYKDILSLPGIGSYTAGAVASIAFGIPEPAVDGNVLRVMTRIFADSEDITRPAVKKKYEGLLRTALLDISSAGPETSEILQKQFPVHTLPGNYNQAWIELGALICIPSGRPLCEECPLESLCLSKKEGRQEEFPVRAPKKPRRIEEKTVFVIEWKDRVAIRKRSARGLLASLYEFPNAEGHVEKKEAATVLKLAEEDIEDIDVLPDSVHVFSHVEWHMTGYRVRLRNGCPENYKMVKKEEISSKYPVPSAFGVYTNALM